MHKQTYRKKVEYLVKGKLCIFQTDFLGNESGESLPEGQINPQVTLTLLNVNDKFDVWEMGVLMMLVVVMVVLVMVMLMVVVMVILMVVVVMVKMTNPGKVVEL